MGKKEQLAEEPIVSGIVQYTDLREITRESHLCRTVVFLQGSIYERRQFKWLELGQAVLRRQKESSSLNAWRLEAYLTEGTCDFEHDSAYALELPLIGLQLGDLGIHYHTTYLTAWVDPNAADQFSQGFRVPRPGYNPMKHEKAVTCEGVYNEKKRKYCKWNEGKPHIIVPEGFYRPPFDLELYRAVAGKQVEIHIGPVRKEE